MLWAKLRCRTTTYDQESVLKIKSKPETQRSTDFSAAPFRRGGGGRSVQMTSYCLPAVCVREAFRRCDFAELNVTSFPVRDFASPSASQTLRLMTLS